MPRVYELAEELRIPGRELLSIAARLGIRVENLMSHVADEDVRRLRREASDRKRSAKSRKQERREAQARAEQKRRRDERNVLSREPAAPAPSPTPAPLASSDVGLVREEAPVSVEYFVDNLPRGVADDELVAALSQLAPVRTAHIICDARTGDSLGCAYVRFAVELSAVQHQVEGLGRQLVVVRSESDGGNFKPERREVVSPVLSASRESRVHVAALELQGEWFELEGVADAVLVRHDADPSTEIIQRLQHQELDGDMMGGRLSDAVVDNLANASSLVAAGLQAGQVFQIVGTPGLLQGLRTGSLALMQTAEGMLGTVVSTSSPTIVGQARFAPASLAPVLAPVVAWQILHAIAGTSQLRKINQRLDTMTRQLERMQTRQEARIVGQVRAAKMALDELLAERANTGRFTDSMVMRLALTSQRVNEIFEGNVVLADILRHRTGELQRSRGKEGALRSATFISEEGAQAQFDTDLLVHLELATGGDERAHVVGPGSLVEVHGEEPARAVVEHRVDAHHVVAEEVAAVGRVIGGEELLVLALATLHLRQLAQALHELVGARRPVALFALGTLEACRVDVRSPAEQASEDLELLLRCARRGGLGRSFARRRDGIRKDVRGQLDGDRVERSELGFQPCDASYLGVARSTRTSVASTRRTLATTQCGVAFRRGRPPSKAAGSPTKVTCRSRLETLLAWSASSGPQWRHERQRHEAYPRPG